MCTFRSYQFTCHTSNSSCLFLKLQFQALLEGTIISNSLFKFKYSILTYFLFSSICNISKWHLTTSSSNKIYELFLCSMFCALIIYTFIHSSVFVGLFKHFKENMKHILPSAETELVWQKGQVFGSHTHQFSLYSNPSICWGPINMSWHYFQLSFSECNIPLSTSILLTNSRQQSVEHSNYKHCRHTTRYVLHIPCAVQYKSAHDLQFLLH